MVECGVLALPLIFFVKYHTPVFVDVIRGLLKLNKTCKHDIKHTLFNYDCEM